MFVEYPIRMGDILSKNPKEIACLGFNIADIDLSFRKSQIQLGAYYKEVPLPDKETCDAFFKEIRESPKKIVNQFNIGQESPLVTGMMQA